MLRPFQVSGRSMTSGAWTGIVGCKQVGGCHARQRMPATRRPSRVTTCCVSVRLFTFTCTRSSELSLELGAQYTVGPHRGLRARIAESGLGSLTDRPRHRAGYSGAFLRRLIPLRPRESSASAGASPGREPSPLPRGRRLPSSHVRRQNGAAVRECPVGGCSSEKKDQGDVG